LRILLFGGEGIWLFGCGRLLKGKRVAEGKRLLKGEKELLKNC
jgi:hypothetical protein